MLFNLNRHQYLLPYTNLLYYGSYVGRIIAQAVSRQLPTAAARVRALVTPCGICGRQSGTGTRFLQVLRFPLPIRIESIAPQSSSIIWGWYNRPNIGRSTKWTQSHLMKKNGSYVSCMCYLWNNGRTLKIERKGKLIQETWYKKKF
jgi:hypothetical protein